MRLQSLKSKLLVGVSALVICSGLLISLLVTQRYSRSLSEAMFAQAEYLTRTVAIQAADLVLINDPVALQKLLDHLLESDPTLSYLFIVKDGQVLAHTFSGGMPADLLSANEALAEAGPHPQEISSSKGEHYLDMAMAVFEGKAGTLRLGFSERHYREQVSRLWVQMTLLTLAILLLSLGGSLLFIKRITGPLTELARAVDEVDRGKLDIRVKSRGKDEVAALANSFNSMIASLQSYTMRLEEQTMEIDRAHQQTRIFCGIVQEIGALYTLKEIGSFLIGKFQPILESSLMAMLIVNEPRDTLFVITQAETRNLTNPGHIQIFQKFLDGIGSLEDRVFPESAMLEFPLVPESFHSADRCATIALRYEKVSFGALMVACSDQCRCNKEEINVVKMMLNQAAGVIKRAVSHEEEVRDLQSRLERSSEFCGIVARDPKMQSIFKLVEDIAATDITILIESESGTGKELIARAIHEKSPRKNKPFIVIDCSAYPATLLESELFGHEKGAFTGAVRQKPGRFEQAHGGTVFLDEVGEMPLSAQIKLLRVLQTQSFERLGGEQAISVDVRIIAATNKNLLEEVKKGSFREDLYYRLNVIPIHLPPLRERRNDIPLLARHFLHRFSTAQGKNIEGFTPEAMRRLFDYSWPGNVRELENSIEHAVALAKEGRIEPAHLPWALLDTASPLAGRGGESSTLAEHEMKLLEDIMEQSGWNKKEAARRLKISRSTLYEKLKRYRISRPTTP